MSRALVVTHSGVEDDIRTMRRAPTSLEQYVLHNTNISYTTLKHPGIVQPDHTSQKYSVLCRTTEHYTVTMMMGRGLPCRASVLRPNPHTALPLWDIELSNHGIS